MASEVVRAALRLMEEREARLTELRRLIQEGEDSGEAVGFDFDEWQGKAAHIPTPRPPTDPAPAPPLPLCGLPASGAPAPVPQGV